MSAYKGQFAIILPETAQGNSQGPAEVIRKHISDTMLVSERLRKSIEHLKIGHGGKILGVTVSIGVAYFDGVNVKFPSEKLVGNAQEALFQAKETGRNKVILYGSKNE